MDISLCEVTGLIHFNDYSIVAVPGLGAHPVDSWKGKMGFNFLTDEDGLQKDFPKSRILLYKYESAWQGPLKVKANISNIASTLLKGLNNHRENCRQRPVVFLGHSMGGLVIAKVRFEYLMCPLQLYKCEIC